MRAEALHGDSVELLRGFEGESVHAIISDIPYGIGLDDWDVLHGNKNSAYGGASPSQARAGRLFKRRGKPLNGWSGADREIGREYQSWCASWAGEWLRILKPGGSCLVFAGRRHAHRCACALEDAGFNFKDELAWEKIAAPQRAQRLSAIFARRGDKLNEERWRGWRVANLRPIFEPVFWLQKPYRQGGTIADNALRHGVGAWSEAGLRRYYAHADGARACSNLIKVEAEPRDRGLHPAQKPLRLMELLVALVTLEGQLVLDPFMGSGTTLVAAKNLGRACVGIDLDKRNVQIARRRLAG